MIDDATLRQCVHCGLCLDACPTYLQLGTEMDSPRGRIHLVAAMADGSLPLSGEVVRHLDLCLGCRACETACPSGVRYGQILEGARAEIARRWRRPLLDRLRRRLLLEVFPHRRRLRMLAAAVRGLQAAGLWRLVTAAIPAAQLLPRLGGAEELRATAAAGERRARVAMFEGCVAAVLQGGVNAAAQRVLNRCGAAVEVPAGQGCCGALHLHAGDLEGARRLARANVDAFENGRDPADSVVVTAAGCGAAMREYGTLLAGDARYAAAAARLAARTRDVTEVVDELLPDGADLPARALRVTYHDACHLAHAQGVRQPPRRLLAALPGVELVELDEADLCCGSAGSYNLTEPGMAAALGRRKADNIGRAAVDCVAVGNPGCAMQIAAELRRRGSAVRVAHPVELVDEAMAASGET
jgi:glycolate oxidase iron-sulfur subunit